MKVRYFLKITGLGDDLRIIEDDVYSTRKINHLGFSVTCRFLIALGLLDGCDRIHLPDNFKESDYLKLEGWKQMLAEIDALGVTIIIE